MSLKLSTVTVAVAWVMFVVSFFMPAFSDPGAGVATSGGWIVFITNVWLLLTHPAMITASWGMAVIAILPFGCLMMLVAPLISRARVGAWVSAGLLAVFGLLPWLIFRTNASSLLVGFYVWDLSFFVMAAGCLMAALRRYKVEMAGRVGYGDVE